MARTFARCLLLGAALALLAPAAVAASPAQRDDAAVIRDRASAALDDSIQKEMPGDAAKPDLSPSAEARPDLDPPRPPPPVEVASPMARMARLLLWSLVAAAIALVVVAVVREILGRTRDGDAAREEAAKAGDAVRAAPPISLSEAEALALAGRYAEAIHALLRSVLGHLGQQGNVAVSPATTSREVLDSVRLEAEARGALSDLVLTVEVSLFGGLDVDEGDYARCMASYRRLSSALSR